MRFQSLMPRYAASDEPTAVQGRSQAVLISRMRSSISLLYAPVAIRNFVPSVPVIRPTTVPSHTPANGLLSSAFEMDADISDNVGIGGLRLRQFDFSVARPVDGSQATAATARPLLLSYRQATHEQA